jgi:hypothetical protein
MSRLLVAASLLGLTVCLAATLAGPAHAERLGKGRSLVLVGIGGHRGEFVYPGSSIFGSIESGEVGGEIAYCRFLSDQWTLGISGGYHAVQMKIDENNPAGPPLGTVTFDTHSFTLRIGGDRYAFIDDNVALYAGPGVFFTRGRAKSELTVFPPTVGGGTNEGPDATEMGLDARIGMYARLGKGTALFGHIGQVLSRTSGKDSTGKISWWSSTQEGSLGLALDF